MSQRRRQCPGARGRRGLTRGADSKHMVVKGRQRDTAWFSMTDSEWPAARRGLEAWLADDNFDAWGRQKRRLEELRAEALGGDEGGRDGHEGGCDGHEGRRDG